MNDIQSLNQSDMELMVLYGMNCRFLDLYLADFGVVHSVTLFLSAGLDKESNEKIAIKKVPKVFQDLVDGKRILREIKLLRTFKHENIVSVKDIMAIPNKTDFSDVYAI